MKQPLVLVGGGGHCASCLDVIESSGIYTVAGIVDAHEMLGKLIAGYPVIGSDDDLADLAALYGFFHITLGQINNAERRIVIFERLVEIGAKLPAIVSPHAHVARLATLGEGTIVMHNTLVNARAHVGRNCIVNSGAIIEHDAEIGDHCHVSTGSIVNGGCRIGKAVFIGSNSVLVQGVVVRGNVLVGAGSVVTRNIDEPGVYAGNPARRIR